VEIAGRVAGEEVAGLEPAVHGRHGEKRCGVNAGLGFEVVDNLEALAICTLSVGLSV